MTKIQWFLLIWGSGVIPAYLTFRHYWKRDLDEWTTGTRAINIVFSLLLSWIWASPGLFYLIIDLTDTDKPAKW